MTFPENNDPFRNTRTPQRFSRTTVWAIAGAVVLLLFGLLFFTSGRHDKSAENPPPSGTQAQPQR
ncbi:hypothetical protein GGQ85_000405 [Nitrobacter vulgaris]|nr:hypothetical protein [Nitrobacter vulgaris]